MHQGRRKLRVLGYYSAHLSACQQRYHPFEQGFLGLVYTRRDMIKHLGRIPAILHTDHANIARVEGLPLERIVICGKEVQDFGPPGSRHVA